MSTPQDPFAAPGGEPPAAGQPPAYGQAPAYGQPDFGTAPPGGQGLASWLQRVGGALIDGFISLVLQTIVGLVSGPLGRLAGFALFLYFAYLVGTTGQTPGKRVAGTREFLHSVRGQWNMLAWLNPMPRRRWAGTSAQRIALDPGCTMFEFSEDGLTCAVDALRGSGGA